MRKPGCSGDQLGEEVSPCNVLLQGGSTDETIMGISYIYSLVLPLPQLGFHFQALGLVSGEK